MRQNQLYLEDTYSFTSTSSVIDAGRGEQGAWVTLADNIFHPQGGGQPSDVGTVGGEPARPFRAVGDDEENVVRLSCEREFEIDSEVVSAIDPEVRKRNAALHTCGHVIDSFVRAQGFKHRVSNHFPDQARIEYEIGNGRLDVNELASLLEQQTRDAIESDRKVHAETRGDQRIVLIDDLSEDPCGGTHVGSLGQLTGFSIRSIKSKGGVLKVGYDAHHVS